MKVLHKLRYGYALPKIRTLCTANILEMDHCLFSVMERQILRESERLIHLQFIIKKKKLKQFIIKSCERSILPSTYDSSRLRL